MCLWQLQLNVLESSHQFFGCLGLWVQPGMVWVRCSGLWSTCNSGSLATLCDINRGSGRSCGTVPAPGLRRAILQALYQHPPSLSPSILYPLYPTFSIPFTQYLPQPFSSLQPSLLLAACGAGSGFHLGGNSSLRFSIPAATGMWHYHEGSGLCVPTMWQRQ